MLGQISDCLIDTEIRFDEVLKKHTTIKTGGKATFFCVPKFFKDLLTLSNYFNEKKIPYKIIGNGSNLVFSDKGYKGGIISLKSFNCVDFVGDKIRAYSGANPKIVYDFAIKHGYSSLESLLGIPASLGGMVVMNAGAFNKSISDNIISVGCIRDGKLVVYDKKDCRFGYRKSRFLNSNEIVLFVDFIFPKGNLTQIENTANFFINKRKSSQPKGYSAGSVFKNPKNAFAGKLIESLSLKGERVGGAFVSKEHANFIINDGTASSLDIFLLKNKIQEKVFKEYGINLETEIEFVGEF